VHAITFVYNISCSWLQWHTFYYLHLFLESVAVGWILWWNTSCLYRLIYTSASSVWRRLCVPCVAYDAAWRAPLQKCNNVSILRGPQALWLVCWNHSLRSKTWCGTLGEERAFSTSIWMKKCSVSGDTCNKSHYLFAASSCKLLWQRTWQAASSLAFALILNMTADTAY